MKKVIIAVIIFLGAIGVHMFLGDLRAEWFFAGLVIGIMSGFLYAYLNAEKKYDKIRIRRGDDEIIVETEDGKELVSFDEEDIKKLK